MKELCAKYETSIIIKDTIIHIIYNSMFRCTIHSFHSLHLHSCYMMCFYGLNANSYKLDYYFKEIVMNILGKYLPYSIG